MEYLLCLLDSLVVAHLPREVDVESLDIVAVLVDLLPFAREVVDYIKFVVVHVVPSIRISTRTNHKYLEFTFCVFSSSESGWDGFILKIYGIR